MGKLRVHELAKELGRENKEVVDALAGMGVQVTSHMSMVEEGDCEKVRARLARKPAAGTAGQVERPTEAREAGEKVPAEAEGKPKKKNIVQVFRPQNSKTGMVRPGQRPGQPPRRPGMARPQGGAAGRPQGQPGMTRPQGGVSGRPQGQPGMARPQGTGAAGRPQRQPGMARPQGAGAAGRPQGQPGIARPQGAGAAGRPQAETGSTTSRPQAAAAAEHTAERRMQAAETMVRPQVTESAARAQDTEAARTQTVATRPQAEAGNEQSVKNQPASGATAKVEPARNQGNAQARPQNAEARSQGSSRPAAQGAETRGSASGRSSQGAETRGQTSGRSFQSAETRGQTSGRSSQGAETRGGFSSRTSQPGNRADRGQGARTSDGSQGRGQGYGSGRGAQSENRGARSGDRFGGNRSQGGPRQERSDRPGTRDGRAQGGRSSDGRSDGRYQGQRGERGQGGRVPNIPKAPVESKPLEKEGRVRNERGNRNDRRGEKQGRGDKLDRMERSSHQNQKTAGKGRPANKQVKQAPPKPVEKEETIKNLILPESLTIKELADKMKVQPAAIIKKLFLQGKMVTVNQEIDFDTAEEIALEFNCICEKEEKIDVLAELLKEEADAEETLKARPPVVCVMGHVDHGKTSLLDAIRNTHVIDREAGGITQHIGASVVNCNGQTITFLDTPGHEAFTAMRMRGANSTDIAILVVAADDGVMPQTVEAINHAKAAGIEIIVAINKIDKPSANVEKVKQELTEYDLVPEDWGGSTVFVPVSARTHEGIDNLLEMILLTAEMLELKANPKRRARGLVIEAQLDKGRGPVATVLVQKGMLHVGDPICAGPCYGKIRAMMDDKGRKVTEAGPSTPVEILGFSDVPGAGEIFISPETEKEARNFAETFISEGREKLLEDTKSRMSLDDLFSQIQAGSLKELNLIVKADVQGSVEAVRQSLLKLSNDEVVVKIIHGGVGAINESDVILASASNAIIIGFNVRPDAISKATAEREGVDVRLYRVIYDAIADVEAAMKGMLDPIFEEKVIGHAEVRQTFKASGVGTIAGAYVLDGVFQRGCSARITREGKQIFDGALASLKRFKDDVKEVRAGYECGLVFEKFNDIQEQDQIEAYIMVEVPR